MSRLAARIFAVLSMVLAPALQAAPSDTSDTSPVPGRRASHSEIAAADITVFPDGSGLRVGRAPAREGRLVFSQHCAACHGERGGGTDNYPALAGGVGSLRS